MSQAIKQLEMAALEAFNAGVRWTEFLRTHHAAIKACEPYNLRRYHRLTDALMHLCVSGEASGAYPPGDPDALPWLDDDDMGTQQLMLPGCDTGEQHRWGITRTAEQGEDQRAANAPAPGVLALQAPSGSPWVMCVPQLWGSGFWGLHSRETG